MAYRVGQGYDVHRLVAGKALVIGGVKIESPVGSEAHSDGDVLLHSLIDALLGACGLGDIGEHFSPSDPQWKDADSAKLLTAILPMVSEKGYQIGNVDATVFLEAPKLLPYKVSIRNRVCALLDLPAGCVAVKAKTAEKFPPIGTQEAIAAAVTVLLYKR